MKQVKDETRNTNYSHETSRRYVLTNKIIKARSMLTNFWDRLIINKESHRLKKNAS